MSIEGFFLLLLIGTVCTVGCDRLASHPKADSAGGNADETRAQAPKSTQPNARKSVFDTSIPLDDLLAARLPTKDLDEEWIRLFDTATLMGWTATTDANWHVEDQALVVDKGNQGFLMTTSRFSDFELRLEFFTQSQSNSGVFLRTMRDPKRVETDCFELNIAPTENPFPTGSLVGRQRVEPATLGELDPNEWHTLHALCDGVHIQSWIDGKACADYRDASKRESGYLGLQFREGAIRFRDIRIRPISYKILPAKSLKEWKLHGVKPADNAVRSSLTVNNNDNFQATIDTDGQLKLSGGRGSAEVLQNLDNFVLQSVFTAPENTNSGIFFRCIPGEVMNGYECQIHHGFTDDRRAAVDAGTGAIFRRQPARVVMSEPSKPTHVTLIADGDHFSSWVEGVQVVDWRDERPEHVNPREGRRLESGTIQFQGHDPTTAITVSSLTICPIP